MIGSSRGNFRCISRRLPSSFAVISRSRASESSAPLEELSIASADASPPPSQSSLTHAPLNNQPFSRKFPFRQQALNHHLPVTFRQFIHHRRSLPIQIKNP